MKYDATVLDLKKKIADIKTDELTQQTLLYGGKPLVNNKKKIVELPSYDPDFPFDVISRSVGGGCCCDVKMERFESEGKSGYAFGCGSPGSLHRQTKKEE